MLEGEEVTQQQQEEEIVTDDNRAQAAKKYISHLSEQAQELEISDMLGVGNEDWREKGTDGNCGRYRIASRNHIPVRQKVSS